MTERDALIMWEEVGFLPDCGIAALGDVRLLDDGTWAARPLPFLRALPSGHGMIYGLAECDGLPVEIGRRENRVVAARLEFTNDLAQIEAQGGGRWTELGRLRVDADATVACDKKQQHLAGWMLPVPIPGGWYVAEAFETDDDHLGVRLIVHGSTRSKDPLRSS